MRNIIPLALLSFDRLEFKAPPADIFEELLGYAGSQRFIGFHYTGQALGIEDGQTRETGDRRPWSIWYRSLGVAVLRYYCFGYEGRAPEHMLILDRNSRTLYAAPMQAGQDALRQQVSWQPQAAQRTLAEAYKVDEDPTEMLFTQSGKNLGSNQVGTKEGIKELETWLKKKRGFL